MISADYILIGAGLTSATIARQLVDAGREVLILEKRSEIGGNCSDTIDPVSGQRFGLYGPHYFRTNSSELWDYVQRFAPFKKFEAVIKSVESGKIYDYPVTQEYIDCAYPNGYDPFQGVPQNFEEVCLSRMPEPIYRKFIHGYTLKQWQRDPKDMDASLASRVEVRQGKDRRLSTKKFQGVPANGYTHWIANMLNGIPVELGVDYLARRSEYAANKQLIFTGAIDAFFNYEFGRLEYRSQSRMHTYYPDVNWMLPACQVNYPHPDIKIIREIEWKHIWPTGKCGTLITQETPIRGGEEYPVPDQKNLALYQKYRDRMDGLDNVMAVGRLAEYKYYDMDQMISRAMLISERILND